MGRPVLTLELHGARYPGPITHFSMVVSFTPRGEPRKADGQSRNFASSGAYTQRMEFGGREVAACKMTQRHEGSRNQEGSSFVKTKVLNL